ncbi:cytochrome P450 [Xylariales sp. PMI_506]|nr:cytochrome P450 [Xylariales sp. PMI_506]
MAIGGLNTVWLLAAGVVGTVGYFVFILIRHRAQFRDLPCPPHSMFWGHLKLMGEYTKKLPPGIYTHSFITQMRQDYDLGDFFYLDLWPVGPSMIVCASPEVHAISTTQNNGAMPAIVIDFFRGNVGDSFIEVTNGALWKRLHHMLAPGLTPNSVKVHISTIIDLAGSLHTRFQDLAKSGEVVDMRFELGKYPFQVISHFLLNEQLGLKAYEDARLAVETQTALNASLNPISKWKIRKELNQCFRRIEKVVEARVRTRFAELQKEKGPVTMNASTTILDRMMLPEIEAGRPLDSHLMKLILDNVNGSLVAGYGTTTDTSNYIFMLLAVFPDALKKLRAEHDRVFDKDFAKTVTMLRENPSLLKELKYTTAVINETLRMFPIGMGIREPPVGMTTFEHDGRAYPTKGHKFALGSHNMHYNEKYFPEPKKFNPDRFMVEEPTFPRNAYRPFERGVRSCLGQALAMDEMKIMLLLIIRWFNFELRDQGVIEKPVLGFTDLHSKLGRHAYQSWAYTAAPNGPVNMKVSLVKNA